MQPCSTVPKTCNSLAFGVAGLPPGLEREAGMNTT
jgi:hypothetical protein